MTEALQHLAFKAMKPKIDFDLFFPSLYFRVLTKLPTKYQF